MTQYMEKLEAALRKMEAYMITFEDTKTKLEESNVQIQTETMEALENMTAYTKKTLKESSVAIRSETTEALENMTASIKKTLEESSTAIRTETTEALGNMTDYMKALENTKKMLEESNLAIRTETTDRFAALQHNITEMHSQVIVPAVSFNVRKAKNLTPPKHQVMTFELVIQNMGGAYNDDTGIFTAPYDGTYLFGVQVCAKQKKYGDFNLVVDNRENEILVVVDYDEDNAYTSSSGTAVHYLTKGQRVWVVNMYKTELLEAENWCWNQFTGVLIHL